MRWTGRRWRAAALKEYILIYSIFGLYRYPEKGPTHIRPQFRSDFNLTTDATGAFNSSLTRDVPMPVNATTDQLDNIPLSSANGFKEPALPWYADQVLPFDITIAAANEYGAAASAKLFGVEILNEGFGSSVDDSVLEQQATFIARSVLRVICSLFSCLAGWTRGCRWAESKIALACQLSRSLVIFITAPLPPATLSRPRRFPPPNRNKEFHAPGVKSRVCISIVPRRHIDPAPQEPRMFTGFSCFWWGHPICRERWENAGSRRRFKFANSGNGTSFARSMD